MRCAYSMGSMANLRQCTADATHVRIYLNSDVPFRNRKVPACAEHRFAKGDEGRRPFERGYELERLPD